MRVFSTFRNSIAGLVCTLLCHAVLYAGNPSALLIDQFKSVDSALAAFEHTVRPSKCDSAGLAEALENLLHQHDGLTAVAFADVRGNVIGFSGYTFRDESLFRKVSGREWYRTPRKMHRPYYGPLVEIDRRFYCLWSRPLLAQSALGMTACEGVLVAYVNIAGCFRNFSEAYRRPFEVGRGSAVFYHSDDWQSGLPFKEELLSLQGGVEFTLRYADRQPADSATADALPVAASSAVVSVERVFPSTGMRGQPEAGPGGTADTAHPARRSGNWMFLLVAVLFGMGGGLAYAAGRLKKRGKISGMIVKKEKVDVRNHVAPNAVLVEKGLKAGPGGEREKAMGAKETDELRRELKTGLREKIRAELLEEIRRQLVTTENAALREEARGKLLEELTQRLRKEVGGQLEMEALQALTRTLHHEVRAEHAKSLKERAFKDLDERIRQEVTIRERAMLLASARASLKETIEKEIREKEGDALREEARAAVRAENRSDREAAIAWTDRVEGRNNGRPNEDESTRETVFRVAAEVRGTLLKIDESESLLSLVKTVELLKSSQRDSPYFNLNAAQTSSMIEYLADVTDRMQRYVAEVKNGLGRLNGCFGLLPGTGQHESPVEQKQYGTDPIKTEEAETIVGSK